MEFIWKWLVMAYVFIFYIIEDVIKSVKRKL